MTTNLALGIDIGGSGIKAGVVDVTTGELVSDREVIPTPGSATRLGLRAAVLGLARRVLSTVVAPEPANSGEALDVVPWGVAFPGVIKKNTVLTAANLNSELIGSTAHELFGPVEGESPATASTASTPNASRPEVVLINDADAAGIAEARFGVAADVVGSVMVVTLGTGIGTALLNDRSLVANTELGHLMIDGKEAEAFAAARVRKAEGLQWDEWGVRLNAVLTEYERLLRPDLFVIGGAVSKHLELYQDTLTVSAEVVAAAMGNNAGIIGAALAAAE